MYKTNYTKKINYLNERIYALVYYNITYKNNTCIKMKYFVIFHFFYFLFYLDKNGEIKILYDGKRNVKCAEMNSEIKSVQK